MGVQILLYDGLMPQTTRDPAAGTLLCVTRVEENGTVGGGGTVRASGTVRYWRLRLGEQGPVLGQGPVTGMPKRLSWWRRWLSGEVYPSVPPNTMRLNETTVTAGQYVALNTVVLSNA